MRVELSESERDEICPGVAAGRTSGQDKAKESIHGKLPRPPLSEGTHGYEVLHSPAVLIDRGQKSFESTGLTTTPPRLPTLLPFSNSQSLHSPLLEVASDPLQYPHRPPSRFFFCGWLAFVVWLLGLCVCVCGCVCGCGRG